jgi:hypothetical protein
MLANCSGRFRHFKSIRALVGKLRLGRAVFGAMCAWGATNCTSTGLHAQVAPGVSMNAFALTERKDPQLVLAIAEFHARWQVDWRFSEQTRRARSGTSPQRDRYKYFHCHAELFHDLSDRAGERGRWGNPEPYVMIQSQNSAFGVCPTWLLTSTIDDASDETLWRDGALLASLRPAVVQARAGLIRRLIDALRSEQGNDWVIGQLVRFLVDQRDLDQARTVAGECTGTPWWCAALGGFVAARMGKPVAADSTFSVMRRLMPMSVRQTWNDLRSWLPAHEADAYARTMEAASDTLSERLWWLADPLYRAAGNARRVEQDVRQVEIALRSATTQDERYSFDRARGGDAVSSAILRYGWPAYTGWSGTEEERSHSQYLKNGPPDAPNSPVAPPYTTFEYTTDRVRTFPSPRALTAPFRSTAVDWSLAPETVEAGPVTNWWPHEHFRHDRRLVQLPEGQTILLRRQSRVEVVTAVALSVPALRQPASRYDVMLLATPGPSRVDSIDRRVVDAGATVVLRGDLVSAPALLAIEALGVGTTGVDARTRFGFTPAAPLSTLRPGEIALSDIALLRRLTEERVRTPNDSLLDALIPGTVLTPSQRGITLYWESYGTTPEDSAILTVRVASEDRPGLVQRLGVATGLVTDPSRAVTIRWRDAEARGGTATLRGPVPVQMRALTLDLAALRAGRYTIEVLMTLRDGRSAVSRAAVELRP